MNWKPARLAAALLCVQTHDRERARAVRTLSPKAMPVVSPGDLSG